MRKMFPAVNSNEFFILYGYFASSSNPFAKFEKPAKDFTRNPSPAFSYEVKASAKELKLM